MIRLFLLRFFESYFRHRWLYLLPVVIMIGASVIYFYTLTPKYTSGGTLHVNNLSLLTSLTAIQNNDTNWWITPAQATSNELNELFQSDAFIRAVISETDLEAYMDKGSDQVNEVIWAVRRSIRVYPAGNNQVVINATFEDPQISYQLVPAVITSYITWQINTERHDSQVAKVFFSELIEKYGVELDAARQAINDYYEANPPPLRGDRPESERLEIERLLNDINQAAGRYQSALDKAENADLAMAQVESDVRQTYVLLDAPHVPTKPDLSKKNLAIQIAGFIAVGILVSLSGITASTLLERSFRFPVDVQSQLSLPVLAIIPELSPQIMWYRRLISALRRSKKDALDEEEGTQISEQGLASSNLAVKGSELSIDVKLWELESEAQQSNHPRP